MELILDGLREHYGTDWAAMVFTFLSLWRLGNHKRDGFLWGLLAALSWAVFNLTVQTVPGVTANIVFLGMNARGWWKWNRGASSGREPGS